MICDKCNGLGYITVREINSSASGSIGCRLCDRCYGKKELDWIENILGINIFEEKLKKNEFYR
jgi:hypothetical protein